MLRTTKSQRVLSSKHKSSLPRFVENTKRGLRPNLRPGSSSNKISSIISQIEQSLSQLKRCYQNQCICAAHQQPRNSRRRPSCSTMMGKNSEAAKQIKQEETVSTVPELDDLKKSFLTMNGYDSNNIVELYNFYKKNLEKSTRLYGSTSMSNVVNLTHNQSEIRDKSMRPHSGYFASVQDISRQKITKDAPYKTSTSKCPARQQSLNRNASTLKNTNQLVNVANLLADKKKITRNNISQNINCDKLMNQAKRKLHRVNTNENMEKLSTMKENIRHDNYRISPARKNSKLMKSSTKGSEEKKNTQALIQAPSHSKIVKEEVKVAIKQKLQELKQVELVETLQKPPITPQPPARPNPAPQHKQPKSAKSSQLFKSPGSIKSPCLNRAVLLDVTSSNEKSGHRGHFIPRVTANMHDSLLDCEITPKEVSKNLDLESIPFDF